MNAAYWMLAALAVLAIAYRYYSAFLAAKVLCLDDARTTPAHIHNDGHNFHPTNKWVLFGHHFAAITGAGPLIGPVLAAQFGFYPGFFWILFGAMTMFSVGRTIAETAVWPWSQEYTPRSMRGRITGSTAMLAVPAVLVVSYLVRLWLDSHTGVERFAPVFLVGIVFGLTGGSLLFGLGGGRPRPGTGRRLPARPTRTAQVPGRRL